MILALLRRINIALVVIAIFLTPAAGRASVHAVSTDGEATVYLRGHFGSDFDLVFDVEFGPQNRNRSWTFVSILLLGETQPSASASIGLSRGSPNQRTLSTFTYANDVGKSPVYRSFPIACVAICVIELRGTKTHLYALADGVVLGRWDRSNSLMQKPYVQLNAEVSAFGDRIQARLLPIRLIDGRGILPGPTCAFTTQGVVPSLKRGIAFGGTRSRDAKAAFVSLATGVRGDKCR
ncbi:MAG: hypothetical protein ABI182_03430 [Candidatus Baltobacteraceae bacterium]